VDNPGCTSLTSRGHRVKDAYGVACDRFATRDPPTAHEGFAPMRKMAKE
jgi:hypothetical protein